MLDIKFVRDNPGKVIEALRNRGQSVSLDDFLAAEQRRRERLQVVESLKAERNRVSQLISQKKKAGEDCQSLIVDMRRVGDEIEAIDREVRAIETELHEFVLGLPNVPDQSVPVGVGEEDNREVRRWGERPAFGFTPLSHWDIGERLGIVDFERGAKISGARFVVMSGAGAQLERALINFMLDLHCRQHGYREFFPPFIVNRDSMVGTGQLPKFAADMFKIEGGEYYLVPTAEVPVTNLHRDEIIDGRQLPLRYTAYTACFRNEAGAAGRDTRGLIRLHQFNKVELVKFTSPESSHEELEGLTADAERVLQLLGLPYRVVLLCTGDMGAASAKTYDIEVWLPGAGRYREISSCSNFLDYQARRANIRFRREKKAKPEFVHTLNGSGLAVGRTVAAILENFQQADGSVAIPEVLRKYTGFDRIGP
ncbi:MAG: serine--tRNA ligase [Negativicutes bacterium]|nr:serine--tRNA ligase [Negativicutes bacterium]